MASPATSNASTISLRRTCEHALKRCAHMSHLILGALLYPWGELATSSERIHVCTSLFEVVSPGAQDAGEVFLCMDRFVGEVGEITLVGDSAPGVVRIIPGIFPERSLFSR